MGGDGDARHRFQNLSRLLASGKPIRVIVLDTQVYSNTGGQACTSGFTARWRHVGLRQEAQHGKTEVRKEMALIAIAHRGVYVHQTSQAAASHLIAGVLKGLHKRRPVLINVYTPCPVEHGLADDSSQHAARLALESRAFPFLTYDPDGGPSFADCLSLEGNPSPNDAWPTYSLKYLDDAGAEQTMELPVTIADWAATGKFKPGTLRTHTMASGDELMLFHEYVAAGADDRQGRTPFIWATESRSYASPPRGVRGDVGLAVEASAVLVAAASVGRPRDSVVCDTVVGRMETEFEQRADALRRLRSKGRRPQGESPAQIARRLAEGLLKNTGGSAAVAELLASLPPVAVVAPVVAPAAVVVARAPASLAPAAAVAAPATALATAPAAGIATVGDDEALLLEAYIDSVRCTSCNECTNLNNKMFAYNADKQAFVKDAKAGTYQQLVVAAERCPVSIIHPGSPLNTKEKDLPKWVKRAEKFN
jgi:pyruvate-ferredoxin/flavodoxin oxidoreductase